MQVKLPPKGMTYYYIDMSFSGDRELLSLAHTTWYGTGTDLRRFHFGNFFYTEELCAKKLKNLIDKQLKLRYNKGT